MTPRVLIECSCYTHHNVGDAAMLAVAIRQLRHRLPEHEVTVVTFDPRPLTSDGDSHLTTIGPHELQRVSLIKNGGHWRGPRFWKTVVQTANSHLRRVPPSWRARILRAFSQRRSEPDPTQAFGDILRETCLVVASGGGFLSDQFAGHSHHVLDTLQWAQELGIPTAAVGQGYGPVSQPVLLKRMRKVLPRVDFVGLREAAGERILQQEIGVDPARMSVTGDDAIEDPHIQRRDSPGSSIGFNLRRSNYSATSDRQVESLATVLAEFAGQRQCSIQCVPISYGESTSDVETLRMLEMIAPSLKVLWPDGRDLPATIRAVSMCRLMVTGSYHAAVFSLAQGIPVIAIATSDYYRQKFRGLFQMFDFDGPLIDSNDEMSLGDQLSEALQSRYEHANDERTSLLERAKIQIKRSDAAYRRVAEIAIAGRSG